MESRFAQKTNQNSNINLYSLDLKIYPVDQDGTV